MRGPWPLLGLVCLLLAACRQVPKEDAEPDLASSEASEASGEEKADQATRAIWIDADGPWRELPPDDPKPDAEPEPVVAQAPAVPPQQAPSMRRGPSLALPTRRRAPTTGGPAVVQRSPEQTRRERYVANPTRIRAGKITLYCPAAYAREVQLTGAVINDPRPGQRVARGGARLFLRELTLDAEKITLRVRPVGDVDIRITASGNVAYVTEQRGRVMQDGGIRILMIKNEQITPLR